MSDEAVRELEREVRAGAPDAVVARWVEALERQGRLEATLVTARPGDEATRRLCAALPRVATVWGTTLDVEPIRRVPVEVWRRQPPGPKRRGTCGVPAPMLLGGWDGVVVLQPGPFRTDVVDPRTGEVRWGLDGWANEGESRLVGDLLALRTPDAFTAYDLRDGRVVSRVAVERGVKLLDDLLLAITFEGDVLVVTARRWDLRTGAVEPHFVARLPRTKNTPWLVACGPLLGLCRGGGPEGVRVLDRATGALVWSGPGDWVHGDAHGLLVQVERLASPTASTLERTVEARGLDGALRWTRPGEVSKLDATHVVLASYVAHSRRRYELLDRATGEPLGAFERSNGACREALVRDVLYRVDPSGLEAVSMKGEPLWHLAPRSPTTPIALLPLHRRVLVYHDDMTFCALAEP